MTTTNNAISMQQAAVAAMNSGDCTFDVTIICTTDDHQAEYWMERLRCGVCRSKNNDGDNDGDGSKSKYPMVLAVSEDWNASGGAGNGLGTLYAFQKACALARTKYDGANLRDELQSGAVSAALFHTAGKGTRMAPMPASENNNKPGVKLPFPMKMSDGSLDALTVLEAVVKQSGIYAKSRKGRLSVFWGDQVFLPSVDFSYTPTHHVDILYAVSGESAPTAEQWKERGLEKYGVIACVEPQSDGGRVDAAQVEKVDHATATKMLASLGQIRCVGPSLGSFSLSAIMLCALLDEYDAELTAKTAKLDTDPHFWMPLTLEEGSYVQLMEQKGTGKEDAAAHYGRMAAFKTKFTAANPMDEKNMGLFGAVNVGQDACWWDYGQLKLYSKNSLLLLEGEDSASANLLREFLGVSSNVMDSAPGDCKIDDVSRVFGSKFKSGSLQKSIVARCAVGEIDADGAILVNCAAKKIKAGPGTILYNLVDDTDEGIIVEEPNKVVVAVTDESGASMRLNSRMDIDGGKAWKQVLSEENNTMSFEQVHAKNKQAKIQLISKLRRDAYDKVVEQLGL